MGTLPLGDPRQVRSLEGVIVIFDATVYSATGFLSFMNGYTVFLGPFAGIMVTDVSFVSLMTATY